jgi:hypothetical protein
MPEVGIGTANIEIPATGVGISFADDRPQYPPEYFIQLLAVCLPQLI